MEKCLRDYFMEAAGNERAFADRVVKILAQNGIYTMDILMSKNSVELYQIKGIGLRAMNLIGKVMTREEALRKNLEAARKKHCHNCKCVTLRDWFQKVGLSYLSACQLEKIVKRNGVNTIDDFMKTDPETFDAMTGIAKKRLHVIAETKKLIKRHLKWKKTDFPEDSLA